MEILQLDEILEAVSGEVVLNGNSQTFNKVCTDTRTIYRDCIFFALKGEKFDGNDYAASASQKGASICIIDAVKFENEEITSETTVILVKDTRKALLDLAKYYRGKLRAKFIGITGSTGKTSTKDLTAAALGRKYKVFKTKGNFNNEVGLPLMMFQIDNSYDVAILEMGMSNLNEIHRLAEVARPDIALITNIGISHIENLKTRENILKAKMEITDFFNKENILIVNAENDLLRDVDTDSFKVLKTGLEDRYDIYAEDLELEEDHVTFILNGKNNNESAKIRVDIPGKHNILNTLLALACGYELNVSTQEMALGLSELETTSMRLDIVKGQKFTIIDDCYNASPDSMKAAIEVLSSMKSKKKIAVLGTMKELGELAFEAHRSVAAFAKQKGVDCLIVVGEFNEAYFEGFGEGNDIIMCLDNIEASEKAAKIASLGDVVLVKASRSMKFEDIVKELKRINC